MWNDGLILPNIYNKPIYKDNFNQRAFHCQSPYSVENLQALKMPKALLSLQEKEKGSLLVLISYLKFLVGEKLQCNMLAMKSVTESRYDSNKNDYQKTAHYYVFSAFLYREDGWKQKAEKSWLAEAFNSLNRKLWRI